jgi:hypothetical protein
MPCSVRSLKTCLASSAERAFKAPLKATVLTVGDTDFIEISMNYLHLRMQDCVVVHLLLKDIRATGIEE